MAKKKAKKRPRSTEEVLEALGPWQGDDGSVLVSGGAEGLVVRVSQGKEWIPVDVVEEDSNGIAYDGRTGTPLSTTSPILDGDEANESVLVGTVLELQDQAAHALTCEECESPLVNREGDLECATCGLAINPDCPECGARMAIRQAQGKDGPENSFWGCRGKECNVGLRWGTGRAKVKASEDEFKDVGGDDLLQEVVDAREVLEHPLIADLPVALKLRALLDTDPEKVLPLVLGDKTPAGKPTVEARLDARIAKQEGPKKRRRKVKGRKREKRVPPGEKRPGIDYYDATDAPLGSDGCTVMEIPEEGGPEVSSSVYPHHELAHEKLNPIQTEVLELHDKDCNVVVAASTSAGKTLSAEILMGDALDRGAKAIFLSPLRAVSQEKHDDWTDEDHPWSELGVAICTGDYQMTAQKRQELRRADVIVMTSEMLDSKTRRMNSDENTWLRDTLCLVGSSRISLADGTTKTIQEIVEERLDVEVLAFDHATGRVVKRRVTGWHKNPLGGRGLVEVACGTARLTCTEDHEVYQRGPGYTPARKLTNSSVLEVLDVGQEGTQVRRTEHDCADGGGAVGRSRNPARGQFDLVGDRGPGVCPDQGQELPRTKGSGPVEVRPVEAPRADSTEGDAESWLQAGRGRGRVLYEVLRRGPAQDQAGGQPREDDHDQVPEHAHSPDRPGGLVHGRRVEVSGGEPCPAHPVHDRGGPVPGGLLAHADLGHRGHHHSSQEPALRSPEGPSVVRREVHGPRSPLRLGDHVHGTQDHAPAGIAVLSYVRDEVHCDPEATERAQEDRDVPGRGVPEGPDSPDGTDQRREGPRYVYDLTVEGEHNYFAEGILVHNCLVVDEAHLLTMSGRGDALEVGLMRFAKQNPHCRIVLLSATMPNVHDLGGWLTKLNGKPTRVIESKWRPTKLTIHTVTYPEAEGYGTYQKNEEAKRDAAIRLIQKYPDDKWIVFVHAKKAGHALMAQLRDRHEPCEFHSADLDRDSRIRLEDKFRHGDLRVVIATSTLAYGINMPARRVCVLGVHRGMSKVDPIDVQQEFGRAGRVGLDPEGDAYLLLPESRSDPRQVERLEAEYAQVGNIESQLNDVNVLAFHLVAEIAEGDVKTAQDALDWHARSLASYQGRFLEEKGKVMSAERVLEDLTRSGILRQEDDGTYAATELGKVASLLYYSPFDVADWASNFRWACSRDKHLDDDVICWALGNTRTSYSEHYLPREHVGDMGDFEWRVQQKGVEKANGLPPACLAYDGLIRGVTYRGLGSYQRQLTYDVDRVMAAITMIDHRVIKGLGADYCTGLTMRLRYGVSWAEAEMCQIPGVGGRRAQKLVAAGIESILDVLNNTSAVTEALGPKVAHSVVRGAKEVAKKRGIGRWTRD